MLNRNIWSTLIASHSSKQLTAKQNNDNLFIKELPIDGRPWFIGYKKAT